MLWCAGFSLRWLLLLWSAVFSSCAHGLSSCGSWALERRLSSCGARAQLLRGMWDLPGPGLEPVSPALAGGFLTTVPPGKPSSEPFLSIQFTGNKYIHVVVQPQSITRTISSSQTKTLYPLNTDSRSPSPWSPPPPFYSLSL